MIIDVRGAFKKVTADLLRRIEVSFDNQAVRSYELNYIEGAFKKTLLTSITQYDEDGAAFNTHTFEYYDEARQEDGSYKGFDSASDWNTGNDNVSAGLFDEGDASALNGSESKGGGGHLYVGIGVTPTKQNSDGGKVGFNYSESEGLLALIDINGDGLQDKVFKDGGSISYRANQSGPDGGTSFGAKRSVIALPEISEEETRMMRAATRNISNKLKMGHSIRQKCSSSCILSIRRCRRTA
ncbi:MAG: hypothetical protein GY801_17190 [bacterium]|nr:hypothetical protein [bacterium]